MQNSEERKILAIFDFDNTLFDWVDVWYSCFSAMMNEVERSTGIGIDRLADEIREVHQKHGTSEYAFLLGELPSLKPFVEDKNVTDVFADAIRSFRTTRSRVLRLYPGVAESLLKIKGKGCRIAIYTESQSYYSFYRLKRLGLGSGPINGIHSCVGM